MKALVIDSTYNIAIKEVPEPQIKGDGVLIKIRNSGLCGTDMHVLHGTIPAKYPVIPGHEFSGVVENVGEDVKSFKLGDRVTADPSVFCERCYYCRNNLQHLCPNMQAIGITLPGGFAEYVVIKEQHVYKLDDSISFRDAALIEPLACVVHGVDLLNLRLGESVLIFGAGPIGNMLIQLCRAGGGSEIVAVDRDKHRLGKAIKSGANAYHLVEDDGENLETAILDSNPLGFDVVIDATGDPSVVEKMFAFVKNKGKVLFFGVCPKSSRIRINPYEIYRRELSVLGSYAQVQKFDAAINLLKSGVLKLEPIVSHFLTLEELQDYMIEKPLENPMKIQVDFHTQ